MERIPTVVTGLGLISPLGLDLEASFAGLVAGRSGARPITTFDCSDSSTRFACTLPPEYEAFEKEALSRRFIRQSLRHTRMGSIAFQQLLATWPIPFRELNPQRLAVCMGISGASVAGTAAADPWEIVKSMINALSAWISIEYHLEGPCMTVSSACATSADAIAQAYRLIQSGEADLVVTGGADAPITPRVLRGFSDVMAMSTRNDDPEAASRPFDRSRDGFVLGEGAAVLVLESEAHARARGATPLAELRGFGQTSEAHSIMAPLEGGVGMARTMAMAIAHAGLKPADIDYVSAHGTSTHLNDLCEGLAIKRVFGERASQVPFSSQKSMLGHAMGAAGAMEAIVSILSLGRGVLTPTAHLVDLDPALEGLDGVPGQARPARLRHVLSNSFAFGGHNCSLIFGAIG